MLERGDVVEYTTTHAPYMFLNGHIGVVTSSEPKMKLENTRFYPVTWMSGYEAHVQREVREPNGEGYWAEYLLKKIGHIDLDAV